MEFKNTNRQYVACFSESCDHLSQWRAYAQDGYGMSIGFSKKMLKSLDQEYEVSFDKIIYDLLKQEKFIDTIIEENINKLKYKTISNVAAEFNSNYRFKYLLCKNPSFSEEREWRLIKDSGCLQKREVCWGDMIFSRPKFIGKADKFLSYAEMDFSVVKNKFIKEIWIGLKLKVSIEDVCYLLNMYHYYDGDTFCSDTEPILIKKSSSTYI